MKNPHFNPAKKHHRPDGFQNNHQSFHGKRWHEILRWRWEAWRAGHPKPLQEPIPVVKPDLAFIHANAKAGLAMQPAATWIGHITVLLQVGGLNILTRCSRSAAFRFSGRGPNDTRPPAWRWQSCHTSMWCCCRTTTMTTSTRARCWP
jgi:N-acyl-phosphatidylethanolamine-hydrolysing phospholipase D